MTFNIFHQHPHHDLHCNGEPDATDLYHHHRRDIIHSNTRSLHPCPVDALPQARIAFLPLIRSHHQLHELCIDLHCQAMQYHIRINIFTKLFYFPLSGDY